MIKEDPRVLKTKQAITKAFIEISQDKSFEKITIKDLTENAMINRATFYRHFQDKYALLDAVLLERLKNKGFEEIKERNELNEETLRLLINAFEQFIEELQDIFGKNYQTILRLADTTVKEQLIDLVRSCTPLEQLKESKMIATMLVMSIHSATCCWIENDKPTTKEDFVSAIMPFLTGSLSKLLTENESEL